MNQEQLKLYIKYQTDQFNLDWFERNQDNDQCFGSEEHCNLQKLLYDSKTAFEKENVVLDKKYIPQFFDGAIQNHDKRTFNVGDRVFGNIPEDAGEWCDIHIGLFMKEGTVSEVIQDKEFGGFHLIVKFDDGKEDFVCTHMLNKEVL